MGNSSKTSLPCPYKGGRGGNDLKKVKRNWGDVIREEEFYMKNEVWA